MMTGLMSFLIDQRKARVAQKKNIFFVRIGIAAIVIAFAVVGSAIIMIKASNSYQDAIEGIKKDGMVKNEIGAVRGVGLFPTGPDILGLVFGRSPGSHTLIVTVRGENGYSDTEVKLDWPLR